MKLIVFDFDSTLMDGETIDYLADELGFKDEVSRITAKAMAGELDFYDSLTQRVALLKGLDVAVVDNICVGLPLMPGAIETIKALKNKGHKVICFSGGFKNATTPAAEILGLDADFSNILHSVDAKLTGKVGGEMMFSSSKGEMLLRLQNILGVSKEDTVAVGDGANDLSMFEFADVRIAFCANEILKKAANVIVDEKDLTKILDYID